MKNLIQAANESAAKLKTIWSEYEANEKKQESKDWEDTCKIRDQINALNSKKYTLESEQRKAKEERRDNATKQSESYREIIAQFRRKMTLLEVVKRQPETPAILKANNRNRFIECIDEPRNDQYIHVYVYIYQNRKPKNKYTLAVAASSIFGYEEAGLRWTTFEPYFEGMNRSLFSLEIKDAPTVNELKEYYSKRPAIWAEEQFNALVTEYEQVKAECNTPEWELAYLLHKKSYYENEYSRGTETKEYKAIIKQIEAFQKAS